MLLVDGGELLNAVFEACGLLGEFGHSRLGGRDFLLPRRQSLLHAEMIGLRSGEFLLGGGMGGGQRGDHGLQTADFFRQREVLLRTPLRRGDSDGGLLFLFSRVAGGLLQIGLHLP